MENKILFIGEKGSFISHTIIDSLKENEIEVDIAPADVSKLILITDMPDFIMVNLEDSVEENRKLMGYVRNLCKTESKILFITGYSEDIDEAVADLPSSLLGGRYNRPVNTREVGKIIAQKIERACNTEQKHILVVDDSGMFLRTIESWLSGTYKVSLVNSGPRALTFLVNARPDLILLDYEMPECSGPELLEMLRDNPATKDIPVMFLTSNDDKESVKSVLALRPQGYLLKNQSQDNILKKIEDYFAAAAQF